jgi:excisionase family DNA binding protein
MNDMKNKLDLLKAKCHMKDCCREEWLDTDGAAKFLKVDKYTLLNLVSNGSIPYYKFGKRNRYLASELNLILKSDPKGPRP